MSITKLTNEVATQCSVQECEDVVLTMSNQSSVEALDTYSACGCDSISPMDLSDIIATGIFGGMAKSIGRRTKWTLSLNVYSDNFNDWVGRLTKFLKRSSIPPIQDEKIDFGVYNKCSVIALGDGQGKFPDYDAKLVIDGPERNAAKLVEGIDTHFDNLKSDLHDPSFIDGIETITYLPPTSKPSTNKVTSGDGAIGGVAKRIEKILKARIKAGDSPEDVAKLRTWFSVATPGIAECPEGAILSDLVLGDLSPRDALAVAEHAENCPECFALVQAMKETLETPNIEPKEVAVKSKASSMKYEALWREINALKRELNDAKTADVYADVAIKSYQFYLLVNLKINAGLKGEGTGATSSLRALASRAKDNFRWAMARDVAPQILDFCGVDHTYGDSFGLTGFAARLLVPTVKDALNDPSNGDTLLDRYDNFKARGGVEFVLSHIEIDRSDPASILGTFMMGSLSKESFYNEWKGRDVPARAAGAATSAAVELEKERKEVREGREGQETDRKTEPGKEGPKGPGRVK